MRFMHQKVPPDPEGMNDVRATCAKQALLFIVTTGTDWADALAISRRPLCTRATASLTWTRSRLRLARDYAAETGGRDA